MATRERVITIGRDLAAQHGLSDWKVAVQGHNTDPCLGRCVYSQKKLTIETYAADLMSEKEVRGIWLHEIAHALVGHEHDHDDVWEAQCKKIGGIATPGYTPKQQKQIFLNCRQMMNEILTLSADETWKVRNVYSPIATIKNAMSADHSLRLVLAAYRVLTQKEDPLVVANSLNIPYGSVAAVKAWDTMWKRAVVRVKERHNGK
jgi:hypothetical protein